MQPNQYTNQHISPLRRDRSEDLAKRILERLFSQYQALFAIRLWNGNLLKIGDALPLFTLMVDYPSDLRQLVLHQDPMDLAEAYFEGDVEVTGELNSAIALRHYLQKLQLPLKGKLLLSLHALKLSSKKISERAEASVDRRSASRLH